MFNFVMIIIIIILLLNGLLIWKCVCGGVDGSEIQIGVCSGKSVSLSYGD